MKHSRIRPLIWMSVCLAAVLAVPSSFGKAADRQQAQAQVLDHAEYLCDNCFFGPSYYYFCFAADNKILIAYQRIPVINWQDKTKNYLTKVQHRWDVWSAPGQTVPISYDDKHLWVTRPDRKGKEKEVKMIQNYTTDIFTNNDRCRAAVKAKAQ
ncbi:MAG: hypothetical protein ABSB35_05280 [Bryobacteraceae bacterium]